MPILIPTTQHIKCAAVTHMPLASPSRFACRSARHTSLVHALLCTAARHPARLGDNKNQKRTKAVDAIEHHGHGGRLVPGAELSRSPGKGTRQRRDLFTRLAAMLLYVPNSNEDAAPTNRAIGRPAGARSRQSVSASADVESFLPRRFGLPVGCSVRSSFRTLHVWKRRRCWVLTSALRS